MAGCGHLVLPIHGLLLCTLALHLCPQRPGAAAEADGTYNGSMVSNSSLASNFSLASNSSMAFNYSAASNYSMAFNYSADPDSWMNGTEETLLPCQSFQCSAERCYEDGAFANRTETCPAGSYCELYRFSSVNYTAGCSSNCSAELCGAEGRASPRPCALDCCASPLCLRLNASSYGDLEPSTTPATTTSTSTRAPARNGKLCASFSCHGEGCFKGKKTVAACTVGHDFCEMKKTGSGYVAGCSRACRAARPLCAGATKAPCYQECCAASAGASCLRLDGRVHINGARRPAPAPLPMLLAWALASLLSCGLCASLWP